MTAPYRALERELDEDAADDVGALVRGPALTLGETAPVAHARKLLADYRVAAIAVIDERDELRGVVTRTDVLRAASLDRPVSEIMSMFIFALPARAPIWRAAALIAYEGVAQVFVVADDQTLVGIVSAVDITRYFAAMNHNR